MKKVYCPNCGEEVSINDKHCKNCGAKLDEVVYNTNTKSGISNGVLIVLIICATALIITALLLFANNNKNKEPEPVADTTQTTTTVKIPDLKDTKLDDAFKALNELGLGIGEIEYINSKEIGGGNIISTNPTANTSVESGTEVKLFVSSNYQIGEYEENSNTNVLFQVNVTSAGNNVKIRKQPSVKEGESVGNVKTGEIYNVYETTQREGYSWYRIGKQKWIATDGTWVNIDNKCKSTGSFAIRNATIDCDSHMGVYSSPLDYGDSQTWVDSVYDNDKVTIYHSFVSSNYHWYKIGVDRWIRDQGGDRVKTSN